MRAVDVADPAADRAVDVLHDNAGIGHAGDLEATPLEDWPRVSTRSSRPAACAARPGRLPRSSPRRCSRPVRGRRRPLIQPVPRREVVPVWAVQRVAPRAAPLLARAVSRIMTSGR